MDATTPREQQQQQQQDSTAETQQSAATTPTTRPMTNDDFLVPGPTPESNEGWARWGFTWILFSVLLMGMILLMSVLCFGIAKLIGAA
jgi:hypothetical protein